MAPSPAHLAHFFRFGLRNSLGIDTGQVICTPKRQHWSKLDAVGESVIAICSAARMPRMKMLGDWSRSEVLALLGVFVTVLLGVLGIWVAHRDAINQRTRLGDVVSRAPQHLIRYLVLFFLVVGGIWLLKRDAPIRVTSQGSSPLHPSTPSSISDLLKPRGRDVSYAIFSNPEIPSQDMDIRPLAGFGFNNTFPTMFGGTWRITAVGGGFTSTFSVPEDGQYTLQVTHGSSYDDLHRQPGYSPITIVVNSQVVVSSYNPASRDPGKMTTDRWPIQAHAGQNTLKWTLEAGATTHYWIKKIEVIQ
jgi:hypothetical protein